MGRQCDPERHTRIEVRFLGHAANVGVSDFNRIAAIEGLDAGERLPEFSARVFQTEMSRRDPVDNHGNGIVIRHEDAVNWQDPQRDVPELPERVRRARDVPALCIFAMLLGGLNQPR
jgi:hypothetical protein